MPSSHPIELGLQCYRSDQSNRLADFTFEELGRAKPSADLNRLEEYFIRQEGGPTNLSNAEGLLANARHQMSAERYAAAGGDYGP